MKCDKRKIEKVISYYQSEDLQSLLDGFLNQVEHFFRTNPVLKKEKILHSVKARKRIRITCVISLEGKWLKELL